MEYLTSINSWPELTWNYATQALSSWGITHAHLLEYIQHLVFLNGHLTGTGQLVRVNIYSIYTYIIMLQLFSVVWCFSLLNKTRVRHNKILWKKIIYIWFWNVHYWYICVCVCALTRVTKEYYSKYLKHVRVLNSKISIKIMYQILEYIKSILF